MGRWFHDCHRTAAWLAIGALLLVLLSDQITRQQMLLGRSAVPSGNNRAPVEESEQQAEEVLAAVPSRHRSRCRPVAAESPRPGFRHHQHDPLHRLSAPESVRGSARPECNLPLRC